MTGRQAPIPSRLHASADARSARRASSEPSLPRPHAELTFSSSLLFHSLSDSLADLNTCRALGALGSQHGENTSVPAKSLAVQARSIRYGIAVLSDGEQWLDGQAPWQTASTDQWLIGTAWPNCSCVWLPCSRSKTAPRGSTQLGRGIWNDADCFDECIRVTLV